MYANDSTQKIALWIANDGDFAEGAHKAAANDDQNGTRTERHIRDLLSRQGHTSDQEHTLATMRDGVALAEVDWSEVREELSDLNL